MTDDYKQRLTNPIEQNGHLFTEHWIHCSAYFCSRCGKLRSHLTVTRGAADVCEAGA